jgi:hypothetical protein
MGDLDNNIGSALVMPFGWWIMRGVTWGVVKWGAVVVGAGTAVGLGVDVAVSGLQGAQGAAGLVGGLCAVIAVVVAIVGWANEKRSSAVTPVLPVPDVVTEPSTVRGGGGKYVVDARDAKHVQIGDGNTMNTGDSV